MNTFFKQKYLIVTAKLIFLFTVLFLIRYGFNTPEININYKDVSTYYKSIDNLRDGVDSALKNGASEFILPNGVRVKLTINPILQGEVNTIFRKYQLPVGAFVAIEPESGKVLALTGYSSEGGVSFEPALKSCYPAASLVKIITASAVMEELNFSPAKKISYRSGIYKVSRLDIKTPESKKYPRMSITEAMAKSANNVFGKLTAKYLGRGRLIKYLDKFHFSKSIPFELKVQDSCAEIPEGKIGLARAGAGFGKVMISPLHASMIGASIANDGTMMKPYLIESIEDSRGNLLYVAEKDILTTTVESKTAKKMINMMKKTPLWGTLRKAFSKRKWKYFVKKFNFAGKTGSITWGPPKLHYEWSLGIAPADSPSIAFISMTGNKDLWYIKSTYIAREAIAGYFDYDYKKFKSRKYRKRGRRNKI